MTNDDSIRCVITGASGTLASFLVRRLLGEGCSVAVLVRPSSDLERLADIADRLTITRTDLRSFDDSARVKLREFSPDVLFHLAWHGVNRGTLDSAEQIHVNLPMTLSVFREAAAAGVHTWIGVGSVVEYGHADVPVVETAVARPVSVYAIAKYAAGLATRTLCEAEGIRYLWARLSLAYGQGDNDHRFIPTVIRGLQAGQTPELTRGDQLVDFIHSDDAAAALWALAANPAAEGIFNVASGDLHSVREVAEMIRDLVAPASSVGFGRIEHRSAEFRGADISRLRAVTGWAPRVSLRDGLRETADWFAQHPEFQRGRLPATRR